LIKESKYLARKYTQLIKRKDINFVVNGTSRKLKPAELLKASTTANPITDKYIQDKKEEKKAGKVVSSLVRNAKMTPAEAKEAVIQQDEPKQPRSSRIKSDYVAMNGTVFRK
jgi:hypothetical protein